MLRWCKLCCIVGKEASKCNQRQRYSVQTWPEEEGERVQQAKGEDSPAFGRQDAQ